MGWTVCPEESCEKQHQKLCWNPKRFISWLSWASQMGHPVIEGNQVQQAELSFHEAMLAVTSGCVVLQVFFNPSQNHLFHDFPGHWSETDAALWIDSELNHWDKWTEQGGEGCAAGAEPAHQSWRESFVLAQPQLDLLFQLSDATCYNRHLTACEK